MERSEEPVQKGRRRARVVPDAAWRRLDEPFWVGASVAVVLMAITVALSRIGGRPIPSKVWLLPVALSMAASGVAAGLLASRLRRYRRLAEAEEQQRRLVVAGLEDCAIVRLDPDGRIATWNEGAERLLGYREADILHQPLSTVYAAEDRAAGHPARQLREAAAHGRAQDEGWRIRQNGTRIWTLEVLAALRDRHGALFGFSLITRDRTERLRAAATLQASEEQLAATVETAADGIITIDDAGRIESANPAARAMFGFSKDDLIGRDVVDIIPAQQGAHRARMVAHGAGASHILSGGKPTGRRKDGTEFPVHLSVTEIRPGGVLKFVAFVRDVSEQARVEEELVERNDELGRVANRARQLTALIESSDDAIVGLTLDATIRSWNPGAAALYGYTADEVIGRHISLIFPADRQAELRELLERLGRGERLEHFSTVRRCKDGTLVPVSLSVAPIKDADGRVVGVSSIGRNISAMKKAEESQLRAQKLEALGTLAGGIAHDFNNVLMAITGNVRLAAQALPPDHQLRRHIREIDRAASRAAELVERILAFSQPSSDQARQVIGLEAVIEDAATLLRATMPKTIRISVDMPTQAPLVNADASQLRHVIVNIATNAAQAIGDQRGHIAIRLDTQKVGPGFFDAISELDEGAYACLTIADDGCGMDEATMQRIFDPFFTTKPPGVGTGLGLSVAHGIMRSHGGAVTVQSRLGAGSAFRLYFPAAAAPASEIAPDVTLPAAPPHGRGQRVLYVDDEIAIVQVAVEMLELLGYAVVGHTDPVDALRELQSRPDAFDVVVTDVSMPSMSGFEFVREIRAASPDLPIIMTSGYLGAIDQAAVPEAGVVAFLQKPHTLDQLAQVLATLFTASHG